MDTTTHFCDRAPDMGVSQENNTRNPVDSLRVC